MAKTLRTRVKRAAIPAFLLATPLLAQQGAALTPEQDFQNRVSGPGVVWYHDFSSDDEVNAFRWRSAVGNDPGALGERSEYVRRTTADGVTGGDSLELVNTPGTVGNADWWRPFSPMRAKDGAVLGNGRANDDPGAGGKIAAEVWNPRQRGSQTANWTKGYYGHPSMDGDGGVSQDGHEYWLQYAIKIDPKIITAVSRDGGKQIYLTRTDRSLTSQEIVVVARETLNADPHNNYFTMYRSGSPPLSTDTPGQGSQPGIEGGTVRDGQCAFNNANGKLANCWKWPLGEWVTVMIHVVPGTNANGHMPSAPGDPGGNKDTLIEVKVAEQGATQWRTIWHQTDANLPFDRFPGQNALIFSTYMNNAEHTDYVYKRIDNVIFSTEEIPLPRSSGPTRPNAPEDLNAE